TFDQFSTVDVLGIGFILISPAGDTNTFDVEAAAADAMDPAAASAFIFDQLGLTGKLGNLEVLVSNDVLGSATFSIQPDGRILVNYQPNNGTEGTQIITLRLILTTPLEIQNACPPGTISDGATVTETIIINQTVEAPVMVDPTETDCTNSIDDDGDGDLDCADADCAADPACELPNETTCDDTLDNDGDGLPDCLDSDCDLDPACETGNVECSDLADNDLDTLVNCADPGCNGLEGEPGPGTDVCEFGTEVTCDDMFDNDADTNADCLDMNCDGLEGEPGPGTDVCEFGTEVTCDDMFDNDAGGDADCADTVDCPDGTTCDTDMICDTGACVAAP
ncbi:MAG: hypothetical protein ACRENO_08635, partial [Thermodesulfobacteriota bacterium]